MIEVRKADTDGPLTRSAQALVFAYMSETAAESGLSWPDPAALPEPLLIEYSSLASVYARPGALLVGFEENEPFGCVGLRALGRDRGEVRRLYVLPQARQHGRGRALMDACVETARASGFQQLVLDVMPSRKAITDWYLRYGFEEIEPYEEVHVPMIFLGMKLG